MPTDRTAACWRSRYGALTAALAISALCQAFVAARSPIIAKDGIGFIRIARSLANDPAATMHLEDQHPGYPAMVLASERCHRWLTGQDEFQSFLTGARLASGLCGLFTVLFLWLFAHRLYDERIANVTVLLAAVWPLFRLNASDGLSDTPHLMFYLAAAWLAAEGFRSRRIAWFAAAGIASGLAFWVRPEGLVAAAATGLVLAIDLFRAKLFTRAKTAVALIALVVAMSLTAAPYVVMAGKITSKKLPFRQPVSAHAAAVASVEPTAGLLSEPAPGRTLPDEFSRPATFIGTLALGFFELGRELAQGFYYLALIPLAVGTFAPGRQRPEGPLAALHIVLMNGHSALLILLYLTAGYISHRHALPLIALMLPTTAAGAVWLADEASRRWALAVSPRRALALVVCLFYVGLLPKCLKPLHSAYQPVLEAASWVKKQAHPGDSVLSTSGYVRFYANLPGILVGSEAPNLPIGLYFAPDKTWSYIVLEVDQRSFDREALCGAAGQYDEVMELAAHPRKPWAKVLVFRARASVQREPASVAQRSL